MMPNAHDDEPGREGWQAADCFVRTIKGFKAPMDRLVRSILECFESAGRFLGMFIGSFLFPLNLPMAHEPDLTKLCPIWDKVLYVRTRRFSNRRMALFRRPQDLGSLAGFHRPESADESKNAIKVARKTEKEE